MLVLLGILSGSKSYGEEKLIIIEHETGGNRNDVMKEVTLRYVEDPSWKEEVDEFAEAISNDMSIIDGCSADALRTIELVYEIYAADNEWVRKYLDREH